jgi:RecB family exonuclease
MERINAKAGGWETPPVFSFNRWVKDTFDMMWTPYLLLPKLRSLELWHEAAKRVEPLEGLNLTPSLYLELQRTFDVLTRHRHEVTGPAEDHTLANWRRNVSRHFLSLLESHHYLPWAKVLDAVGEAIRQGKISLPENIILTGFDRLYPAEEALVQIFCKRSTVTLWCARNNPSETNQVRVYATPEQECRAICSEVLRAWNEGLKKLGVVFLDRDYFGLLKQCFDELTDREERPPYALRYNLTVGIPLAEHPLFHTAVLPLCLLEEPASSLLLSSLLCSPYVKKQRDDWDRNVRTALWNSGAPATLTDTLARLREIGFPVKPMEILSGYQAEPLKVWLDTLRDLWEALGFSVCGCETDTLAREHLFQIVEELERETGHLEVKGKDLLAWFIAASQGIEVVEKTPESAGIQILNPVECRGLAFARLWVVGTHGRALPEPVRDLPFLDPDERRIVAGGTVEEQWETGMRTVSYLFAAAPVVTFSRAASRGEDEPYLECPLIPDESPREDPHHIVDLWKDPPMEWMRARWLREGITGLLDMDGKGREKEDERVDISLPQVLNVTNLETILSCPFKYFAGSLLSLEPLEDPVMGITPLERGEVIHRILRDFTHGLITAEPEWPVNAQNAFAFLKETVDRVLAGKPDNIFWRVERLRLLGDDTVPGLLSLWLTKERERALQGWKFEVAEEPFEGLRIGESEIMLKGKVDRIDSHPDEGMIIWDYKTGDVPNSPAVFDAKVAPQLPAYLLALTRNLMPRVDVADNTVRAGYIHLKKVSEVKISPLKAKKPWEEFLREWESSVEEKIDGPLNGLYLPDPRPSPVEQQYKNACENCEYFNLCNYLEKPDEHGSETEEA